MDVVDLIDKTSTELTAPIRARLDGLRRRLAEAKRRIAQRAKQREVMWPAAAVEIVAQGREPKELAKLDREDHEDARLSDALEQAITSAHTELAAARKAAIDAVDALVIPERDRLLRRGIDLVDDLLDNVCTPLAALHEATAPLGSAAVPHLVPGVLSTHLKRWRDVIARPVVEPLPKPPASDAVAVVVLRKLDDLNPMELSKKDRRRLLRVREWLRTAPWPWNPDDPFGMPAAIAEDAIAVRVVRRRDETDERAALAAGSNGAGAAQPVARPALRFLRREGPYNPGELGTLPNAEELVAAGAAEWWVDPDEITPTAPAPPEPLIAMRFRVSETPYGRDQVAGFGPRQAEDYLRRGVAELVHPEDAARVKATPPPAPVPPPDPDARITLRLLGPYDAQEGGRLNRGEKGTFRIAEAERMLADEIAERDTQEGQ